MLRPSFVFSRGYLCLVVLGAFATGCVEEGTGNPDGTEDEENTPFGVPPGCDPDGVEACPSDWFVCAEDDAGNKRCEGQVETAPEGDDWVCEIDDGVITCRGDQLPEDEAYWVCEAQGDEVTCTTGSYVPATDAGGDGVWDCWYEGEFVICVSGDDESEGPPDGPEVPDDGADICFFAVEDPEGPPLVTGWYEFEVIDGIHAVHIALAFNEGFVDNTYGENTSPGYDHKFRDLVGSDKAVVAFLNGDGEVVFEGKFDYISESDDAPSGYDCFGVTDGDGKVEEGEESDVLAATSSLDRNLNELGCVFLEDSPAAGECPGWDYRVVYEMWLDASIFGASGFREVHMNEVHASPSRTENTIEIEPGPCP